MTNLAQRERDCPECRSAGSVENDVCQVCLADFGELTHPMDVDPPEEAPALRFDDVVRELREIADLSSSPSDRATSVAAACRRAEFLLWAIRRQFLGDVVSPFAAEAL